MDTPARKPVEKECTETRDLKLALASFKRSAALDEGEALHEVRNAAIPPVDYSYLRMRADEV